MQEATPPTVDLPGEPAAGHATRATLWRLSPYLAMLALAVVAVGWTDLRPGASLAWWRVTAVVYALVAVHRVWTAGPQGRWRRVGTQLLHWGVFLVVMLLIENRYFGGEFNDVSKGLLLLVLLALATFMDGLYVDWRFCVVGVLLGAGGMFLAFLDEAAVAIAVLGLVAVAALFLIHSAVDRRRRRRAATIVA